MIILNESENINKQINQNETFLKNKDTPKITNTLSEDDKYELASAKH